MRIRIALLVSVMLLGVIGCSNPKVTEVASIRLQCVDYCSGDQKSTVPFTEKTFTDTDEIRTFVNAINKASKMSGILDYGTGFLMYVSYKEGSEKSYVLNIADSDEEDIRGLLVDTKDSGQGYEIPAGIHTELKKLIYQH